MKERLFKSLLYLFIGALSFSFFLNISKAQSIYDETITFKDVVKSSSSDVYVKDGTFNLDAPQPIIYNSDFFGLTYILDNGDESLSLDNYDFVFYITKDKIVSKAYSYITQIPFTNDIPDLSENDIYRLIDVQATIAIALLLILSPLISFIGKLFSILLIVAPVCNMISRSLELKLTYKQCIQISIYSLTLSMLLKTLLSIVGLYYLEFSIFYYIIALTYCNFALKHIKNAQDTTMII